MTDNISDNMTHHPSSNTAKRWKIYGLVTLAIPFIAMLIMVGINLRALENTEYRVAITGYDPRDLLRGHYLIFRYQWPENAMKSCDPAKTQCCACFSGDPQNPDIKFLQCTSPEATSCPDKLALNGLQPENRHLNRYYIPEQQAQYIENLARQDKADFSVGLVLYGSKKQPSKNGRVKMLYIDNKPLPQFLKEQSVQ